MSTASIQHTGTEPMGFPRLSLEMAAVMATLLGAWAAIVPFVGPLFSFSADGSNSWHWNLAHSLLFLVPGATAFVAALAAVPCAARRRQGMLAVFGVLLAACGAWLIVGPFAWPVLQSAAYFHGGATALHNFLLWIGYSLGPGGLLMALGAFIIGRDRFQVDEPRHARRDR